MKWISERRRSVVTFGYQRNKENENKTIPQQRDARKEGGNQKERVGEEGWTLPLYVEYFECWALGMSIVIQRCGGEKRPAWHWISHADNFYIGCRGATVFTLIVIKLIWTATQRGLEWKKIITMTYDLSKKKMDIVCRKNRFSWFKLFSHVVLAGNFRAPKRLYKHFTTSTLIWILFLTKSPENRQALPTPCVITYWVVLTRSLGLHTSLLMTSQFLPSNTSNWPFFYVNTV